MVAYVRVHVIVTVHVPKLKSILAYSLTKELTSIQTSVSFLSL